MSIPSEPEEVKRIVSLISSDRGIVDRTLRELETGFGPADWKSPLLSFDRTRYYEREMGAPLVRRFAAFLSFETGINRIVSGLRLSRDGSKAWMAKATCSRASQRVAMVSSSRVSNRSTP